MDWLIAGIALAGLILNIRHTRLGFLLWMVSNAYWFRHNMLIGECAQAVLYWVFFWFSVGGFISWGEQQRKLAETKLKAANRLRAADIAASYFREDEKKMRKFCDETETLLNRALEHPPASQLHNELVAGRNAARAMKEKLKIK